MSCVNRKALHKKQPDQPAQVLSCSLTVEEATPHVFLICVKMNLALIFALLEISVGGFIVARVDIRLRIRMSKMILDDKS